MTELLESCAVHARAVEPARLIERGPSMRGAGPQRFTLDACAPAATAVWSVEREVHGSRRVVARAHGRSLLVELPGGQGSAGVYHVRAAVAGLDDCVRIEVFPPGRSSSFVFAHGDAPAVVTYVSVPPVLTSRTGVTVVMHGRARNAAEYLEPWIPWAARAEQIVLAPCFDHAGWPGSSGYNLGNVFSGSNGRGERLPESDWSFTIVEALHRYVREGFGLEDEGFALWGHSAGGQFVHRFLLFKPQARVRSAIASGCGWFTVPDLHLDFPYGLRHPLLSFAAADVRAYVARPLVIMRGTLDTIRDDDLRIARGADAQGADRYARAAHMHRIGRAIDPGSPWRLVDVPGVGHDGARMALAAQERDPKWSGGQHERLAQQA